MAQLDMPNQFLFPGDDYSYNHDEDQQQTASNLNENDGKDGESPLVWWVHDGFLLWCVDDEFLL